MNKINNLIECQECKNYANRTPIDKITDKCSLATQYVGYIITIPIRYKFEVLKMRPELWAKSGKACIEKYRKMECLNEEHAIIIINHKKPKKNEYVFGSGVDLLVKYFISNSIKFKIFDCYNSECFYKSIKESKAQNLWVFGHGDRHGISFGKGKGEYCPFCKIGGTSRRTFIAQLHCCNQTGKTLWEYLSDKPGIFSEGFRNTLQNREDIAKWIEQNSLLKN